MFIPEEEFHNSHKREAFGEFAESHYLGSGSKQNPEHSVERFPQSHESLRDASESEFFKGNSRKSLR